MRPVQLLIDTNLLVLFVVGTASRDYIEKHKRLTEFVPDDYDALLKIISNATSVLVTPNTLTETSNLAAYIGEPARSKVFAVLKNLITSTAECYIPSNTVTDRQEFIRLGLTDSLLIEACSEDITLITTDLNLYLAAQSAGSSAINFNQIRDTYLGNVAPH
ncbi:PIN domain-containing protein [Chromobacterium violaceum]|uniref:PIN domain-containing protein n=1 Tax=Chromobacterium violaceum (strain ATCC 12472 / DSM 30191 / JCM 1249 / CCUG 213 / NBRC 12614 / NCIMB 9131 / NCTC 9757 / MK) TaxID=243365 RepID=Q7NV07_CHRVO|nr:PIN domain-containing protein [Chromobacterium violaceum]AAQ60210.1 hypothetical protein CV_2539 [Chromobacterium violaceum ATCC 12472]